ncbi:hypothetical protein [Companilactobacillus sp. HBUAS56257]|uniref:hypothetical protein n=1 Tax=Companilactobacillus sp. HBUAS56257 TaxID=3109360 RepID=UPI002FF3F88E
MGLLFFRITFIFIFAGLIPAIGTIGYSIFKKDYVSAIINTVVNGILILAAYLIIFMLVPNQYFVSIVTYNLVSLIISLSVNIVLFNIQNNNFDSKDISLTSVIFALVLLIIFGLFISFIRLGSTKSSANTVETKVSQQVSKAPMPVISSKNKEVAVANSVKTVKAQIQNSLSNVPNSNVYDVDHLRVQTYRGKMVYVAPLDFDGSYFRYRHYKKVDGYFIVDATSKNAKPRFVKREMRYTPSAYFGHDAYRRIYSEVAGSSYSMDENTPQLEIDDNGKPYYISTLYKRIGISNRPNFQDKKVAVLDAENDNVKIYSLKDKPEWLDIAVDPTISSWQIKAWGQERNGWWNAYGIGGSREGVIKSVNKAGTEGTDQQLTPVLFNKHIYYFASMTSTNSKQTSVLGYMYVNAANGKTYYYREKNDAMTPERASSLAENRMKQTQWKSSMPLLYMIDGKPTWIVSMLDDNGAFMSYVYLLASGNGTQSTVAVGNDAKSTLVKYRSLFGSSTAIPTGKGKTTNIEGKVYRLNISGSKVSFILNGDPRIYTLSLKEFPEGQFIQSEDNVRFKANIYQKSGDVKSEFENKTLIEGNK